MRKVNAAACRVSDSLLPNWMWVDLCLGHHPAVPGGLVFMVLPPWRRVSGFSRPVDCGLPSISNDPRSRGDVFQLGVVLLVAQWLAPGCHTAWFATKLSAAADDDSSSAAVHRLTYLPAHTVLTEQDS